jgi:hypothetical protein
MFENYFYMVELVEVRISLRVKLNELLIEAKNVQFKHEISSNLYDALKLMDRSSLCLLMQTTEQIINTVDDLFLIFNDF